MLKPATGILRQGIRTYLHVIHRAKLRFRELRQVRAICRPEAAALPAGIMPRDKFRISDLRNRTLFLAVDTTNCPLERMYACPENIRSSKIASRCRLIRRDCLASTLTRNQWFRRFSLPPGGQKKAKKKLRSEWNKAKGYPGYKSGNSPQTRGEISGSDGSFFQL